MNYIEPQLQLVGDKCGWGFMYAVTTSHIALLSEMEPGECEDRHRAHEAVTEAVSL